MQRSKKYLVINGKPTAHFWKMEKFAKMYDRLTKQKIKGDKYESNR